MNDRVFIDTNILVYYISSQETKKQKAMALFLSSSECYISSQVVNEFISVCLSKNLLLIDEIVNLINDFFEAFIFAPVTEHTIKKALQIKTAYKYSYWDSLIIASALELNCFVLYTEDMQDCQVIEGKLRIVNPFK
ncbi:PilT protein domain-containing protein [Candidatus Magnetoovum chiemensis]|nr:PilT protein domain-containing protein [Candidatus Magnetoovum chiemensis]